MSSAGTGGGGRRYTALESRASDDTALESHGTGCPTELTCMQVILQAIDGPAAGTRFAMRRGQIARIGRTAWADFSVPADAAMAEVHFALEYDAQGDGLGRCDPLTGGFGVRHDLDALTAPDFVAWLCMPALGALPPAGGRAAAAHRLALQVSVVSRERVMSFSAATPDNAVELNRAPPQTYMYLSQN